MKKKLVIITILYLLLDILTKRLALKYFTNLAIIPEFLSFTLAKNTGAAFSILEGKSLALSLVSIFVIIYLVWLVKNNKLSKLQLAGYSLLLAGILGNLIDRICYHYVIDFIHFHISNYSFPIFNVADIGIVVGTFILFLDIYLDEKRNKNESSSK